MRSSASGEYAGFLRRLFAMVIDTGISYLLSWLVLTFTGVWSVVNTITKMSMPMAGGGSMFLEPVNVDYVLRGYQIAMVFSVAYAIYTIAALASPMRGTLGKFVLNVAVVNTQGERIGLFQALVREVLKGIWIAIAVFLFTFIAPYIFTGLVIPFVGGLASGSVVSIIGIVAVLLFTVAMLGVIVGIGIFFNHRKRNVYDFIAGTMAVYAAHWEDEKPAKISMLRRIGGVATLLIFGVALGFPIYNLVQNERPAFMEPIAAQIERLNEAIAAQAKAKEQELRPEPGFESLQPRKRAIDWTGVELVQQVVEEHAISKQVLPRSFSDLGLSNGTLLQHGITRVDVLGNSVLRIGFSPDSVVNGSELVLAPYIDAEGYLGWSCRSNEIRDVDFPDFCDE